MQRVVVSFGLFVLLTLGSSAQAATISQSIDFDFGGSICPTGDFACSGNAEGEAVRRFGSTFVEFNPFDTALGDLQQVVVSIGPHAPTGAPGSPDPAFLEAQGTSIFTNGGLISASFDARLRRGSINGPQLIDGNFGLIGVPVSACNSGPCLANGNTLFPIAPQQMTKTHVSPGSAGLFIDPVGNGLGFELVGSLFFDSTGGGSSLSRSGSGRVRGSLNILYEFEAASTGNETGGDGDTGTGGDGVTPVPLPASVWLLASGFLGLGVMARRRRTTS